MSEPLPHQPTDLPADIAEICWKEVLGSVFLGVFAPVQFEKLFDRWERMP